MRKVLASIREFIFSLELDLKTKNGAKKLIPGLLGWEDLLASQTPQIRFLCHVILHTAGKQIMANNQTHLSKLSVSHMKYCNVLFVVVNQFVWNVHFSELVKNDMVSVQTLVLCFLFVQNICGFKYCVFNDNYKNLSFFFFFLVCMSQDG